MEKEYEENEISLLEIWNKLWKNKFLIIIITFAITIIGTMGVYILNKSSRTITNKFNYHFTGINENKFPDGSLFDFTQYESLEFLELIKASDESFSNIDVEDIFKSESLSFSIVEESTENKETIKSHLYITLPFKYFKNGNQAEDFIKAIHKNILDEATVKNNIFNDFNYFDYTSYQSFTEGMGYDEIITLIELQNKILTESTEQFLSKFVNVVYDNKDLSDLLENYQIWYRNTVRTHELREEVLKNSWVNDGSDTIRKAKYRLIDLERKFELNEKNIYDLTTAAKDFELPGNGESDVFLRKIEELIITNNKIQLEINDLKALIATEGNLKFDKDFDDLLNQYTFKMGQTVTKFNRIKIDHVNSFTRYSRFGNKDFEINQKFNLALMGVVFIMIGGIVSTVVALNIKDKNEIE